MLVEDLGSRDQIYEDDCGGISGIGISIGDGLPYYWRKHLIVFFIFAKHNSVFHQFDFTLSDQVLSQNRKIAFCLTTSALVLKAFIVSYFYCISGNNNFGEITH